MKYDFELPKGLFRQLLVIVVAVTMIFSQFAVIGYAEDENNNNEESAIQETVIHEAETNSEDPVEPSRDATNRDVPDISEVETIEYIPSTPIILYENANGSVDTRLNEETGEYEEFFHYDYHSFFYEHKPGDLIIVNGQYYFYYDRARNYFYDTNGNHMPIGIFDYEDNQYKKPWQLGSDNECILTFFQEEDYQGNYIGKTVKCTFPITIAESLIESVSFIPAGELKIVQNTGGYLDHKEGDPSGNAYGEYYHYTVYPELVYAEGNRLIINGNEEFVFDSERGDFVNENEELLASKYGELEFSDRQYDNHWILGGENYFTIFVGGRTCDCAVTIIERTIESIEFIAAEELVLVENTSGYTRIHYGQQSGEPNEEYYHYYFSDLVYSEGNKIIINGNEEFVFTWRNGLPDFVNSEGEYLLSKYNGLNFIDEQYDNHWVLGSNNHFKLSVLNETCEGTVTIVANPIRSVSFVPAGELSIVQNTGGYWGFNNGDPSGNAYGDYYHYTIYLDLIYSEGNKIIINGTEEFVYDVYWGNGRQDFVNEAGEYLSSKYQEPQISDDQYNNHWVLGDGNHFTISLFDVPCDCTVTIIENPVKSIELVPVEPLYVYEGDGPDNPWGSWYTFDFDEQVYREGTRLIINGTDEYNGGYSFVYGHNEYQFVNNDGQVIEIDFQNGVNCCLQDTGSGGVELYVEYMGVGCTVPVQVIENPISSITFTPVEEINVYEGEEFDTLRGWKEGDKLTISFRTGEIKEYTYKNHVVQDENGDITVQQAFYNGEEYILADKIKPLDCLNDYDNPVAPGVYHKDYTYKGIAFAVEFNYLKSNVKAIQFEFAYPLVYYENCGGWQQDTGYYYYRTPSIYTEGNRLTITYDNDETVVYTYHNYSFRNENGQKLDGQINVSDHQDTNHWTVGSDNYFEISYRGCSTSIHVTIKEMGNVESISFIPAQEMVAYYVASSDEYFASCPPFNNGDVIEAVLEDGTTLRFTYQYYPYDSRAKTFVSENGEVLLDLGYSQGGLELGDLGWNIYAFGKQASGNCIIKDDYVKSVSVKVNRPIKAKDYDYDSFIDDDGTEYVSCYWRGRGGDGGDLQEYALFRQGDTITITDLNDHETVYTFQEDKNLYGFFDEEGNELPNSFLSIWDNGYYSFLDPNDPNATAQCWSSNRENEIYVSYLGHQAEEPIKAYVEEVKALISQTDITVEDAVYSGYPLTPNVTVSYNGETLTEGEDYYLTYSKNVDAGTAYVTITGIGDYRGEETVEFTIAPLEGTVELILSDTVFTYNGEVQKPEVTVKVNGVEVDAEVAYSGNCIDAGSYTATVDLTGNIIGTATAEFVIKRAEVTPEIELSDSEFIYNGEIQMPEVTVRVGGKEVPANIFMSPNSIDAGSYNVFVMLVGNYKGSASTTYSIVPLEVDPSIELSDDTFTYNGKVQHPVVTVLLGDNETPATVTYSGDCVDAGTYTVTASLIGNYSGTAEGTFTIEPLNISDCTLEGIPETVEYDGEDQTFDISLSVNGFILESGKDFTVTYQNNVLPGTASLTIEGIDNCTGTITRSFEITHEHVWDECTVATEPTCTAEGVGTYTCTICGETKTETIPALGHKLVKSEEVVPSCTEAGSIAFWTCETCGKIFADAAGMTEITLADTIVAPTGHEHITETAAKAATCTEAGNTAYWTCDSCGKVFADAEGTTEITLADTVIAPTGHQHLTGTEAKAATCSLAGNIAYWTCDDCGRFFSDAEGTTEISQAETVIAVDNDAHDWNEWIVISEATCTNAGTKYRSCKNNAIHIEIVSIDPLGHTLKHIEAHDATCEEDGNIEYWTCETCGKLFSDAEGVTEVTQAEVIKAAKGHTWDEGQTVTAATCTTEGQKLYTCTACGATRTEVIEALGHDLEKTEAKAATCNEEGNDAYWTCKTCGKYFSDAEGTVEITEGSWIIAALDHQWDEGTITLAPTCLEQGIRTFTCSLCGETRTENVAALGHDIEKTEAKAATCTEAGNTAYWTCDSCGKVFADAAGTTEITLADTVIAPTGHQHLTGTEAKAATCSLAGNIAYWICDDCGRYFSNEEGTTEISQAETVIAVDNDAHDWNEWIVISEATCTKAGTKYRSCKNNAIHIEIVSIDPLGHTIKHIEAHDATCEEEGNIEYWTCETCGKLFSDAEGVTEVTQAEVIKAAKGHIWDEGVITTMASCTESGVRTYTCINDPTHTRTEEIPALGHIYGEPVYAWSTDNSTCTATAYCGNDSAHVLTETVASTSSVTQEPTCSTAGEITFVAVFSNPKFDAQTITKATPASAHSLVAVSAFAPTCTAAGNSAYWTCENCGKVFADAEGTTEITLADTVIAPTGHQHLTGTEAKAATCSVTGNIAYWTCNDCGRFFSDAEGTIEISKAETVIAIDPEAHDWGEWRVIEEPSCVKPGTKYRVCTHNPVHVDIVQIDQVGHTLTHEDYNAPSCETEGNSEYWTCEVCGKYFSDAEGTTEIKEDDWVIPALGHDWDTENIVFKWAEDLRSAEAMFTCKRDPSHVETLMAEVTSVTEEGITTYTATVVFENKTYTDQKTASAHDVLRIFGNSRYDTCIKIADYYIERNKGEKLPAVVLATGKDFPDALTGAYLANTKNAPIMLIDSSSAYQITAYIQNHLTPGGTVYILGGNAVVEDSWVSALSSYTVKRVEGTDRLETNLAILRESGVKGGDIFVCTGSNYADSLSASAINMPILIVGGKLSADQKDYLSGGTWKFHLVGGTSAVSEDIESELAAYGTVVDRTCGSDRFATSKAMAEKFFGETHEIVLAYGANFPDGLCGGPLAHVIDAPIILSGSKPATNAAGIEYATSRKITSGIVVGGVGLIDDDTVRATFAMGPGDEITVYGE